LAEFITDRTLSDVEERTDKGHYNAADFNRVSAACYELKERMKEVGYHTEFDLTKEWTMYDYPTTEVTQPYLDNIYKLINSFYKYRDYELPENMKAFTYEQANDIEKALRDIEQLVATIQQVYLKSGMMQAGGMVIK
jgi:hypothetical protein